MQFTKFLRIFRQFRELESGLASLEVIHQHDNGENGRLHRLFRDTLDSHDKEVAGLVESLRVMAASVPEKAAALSAAEGNRLRDDNEAMRLTIARQGQMLSDRDAEIKRLKVQIAAKPAKQVRKKSK